MDIIYLLPVALHEYLAGGVKGYMGQNIYRQSIFFLVSKLIIDVLLMAVLIGFVTAIKHLLEYFKVQIELTDKTVILKMGILTSNVTEVPYSKINSISVRKGIVGSMLGYGDIVILTGNDVSGIVFKGIENPDQLKMAINNRQS